MDDAGRSNVVTREAGRSEWGGGHVTVKPRETDLRTDHTLSGSGDGGRSHEPRNAGSLQKLENARWQISPGASRRNTALQTLRL